MKKEKGSYYGKGHGKFANLPTEVSMKEYPKCYGPQNVSSLNDTISGIDKETKQMASKRSKYVSNQH